MATPLPADASLAEYARPPAATDDPHPATPSVLSHEYDAAFAATADYQASLPDPVSRGEDNVRRPAVAIQQVGIAGFTLPLHFRIASKSAGEKSNGAHKSKESTLALETRVSGTVGLAADLRAINMSRIIRTFYEFQDEVFSLDTLPKILTRMRETVGSRTARLRLEFSVPMLQRSLRSGLAGYQYYQCVFEAQLAPDENGQDRVRRWLRFDFIYSSACPCSSQLAEHAREERHVYAIPHSQRSRARIWAEAAPDAQVEVEDLQVACLRALQTETQVMVRRSDEQAFAELNGAHLKFVEDAARFLYHELADDTRLQDFQIICSHLESLHSHDAVAVICKGVPGGFRGDFTDFGSLTC